MKKLFLPVSASLLAVSILGLMMIIGCGSGSTSSSAPSFGLSTPTTQSNIRVANETYASYGAIVPVGTNIHVLWGIGSLANGELNYFLSTNDGGTFSRQDHKGKLDNGGYITAAYSPDDDTIYALYQGSPSTTDHYLIMATIDATAATTITTSEVGLWKLGGFDVCAGTGEGFVVYSDLDTASLDRDDLPPSSSTSIYSAYVPTVGGVACKAISSTTEEVVFVHGTATPADLIFARSNNGGSTWTPTTIINNYSASAMKYVDMDVYGENIFACVLLTGTGDIIFAKSTNGGANWSTNTISTSYDMAEPNLIYHDGVLYIGYMHTDGGGNVDIMLAKSNDLGENWVFEKCKDNVGTGSIHMDMAIANNNIYIVYSVSTQGIYLLK